ncbi:sugar transferase [Euzebya rosea]|uniref:sugar transferase n=1 Tax=Euzebya rosea TaxID=2052804 RepID=UPI001300379C|nr:sugar transferase [Euzebya rosea]
MSRSTDRVWPAVQPTDGDIEVVLPIEFPGVPRPGRPGVRGTLPDAERRLDLVLVGVDVLVLVVVWVAVTWQALATASAAWAALAVPAVVSGAAVAGFGPPHTRVGWLRTQQTARILEVSGGAAALVALLAVAGFVPVDGLHVGAGAVAGAVALHLARGASSAVVVRATPSRRRRRVLLVGDNDEAGDLCQLVGEHPEMGIVVLGRVGGCAHPADRRLDRVPWCGPLRDMPSVLAEQQPSGALVAPTALSSTELNDAVRTLVGAGVGVHLSSGLQGISYQRLHLTPLAHEPLLYVKCAPRRRWSEIAKRGIDLAVASVVLVASTPVFGLVCLLVKLQDGGPVLFRQERVGREGRPFTLLKVRTMVVDAEERLEALRAENERQGGVLFKMQADPRVTRLGKLLRRSSIDELPQLINVLRGDMSIVGPRPALPAEAARFSERLRRRTCVRPGITGLWQVEARDSPNFRTYERLDLFYVENWTVALDLAIIVTTVPAVLSRLAGSVRGVLARSD